MWSVVQLEKTRKNEPSEDLGLAHWGRLKLVKSSVFKIFDSLRYQRKMPKQRKAKEHAN